MIAFKHDIETLSSAILWHATTNEHVMSKHALEPGASSSVS